MVVPAEAPPAASVPKAGDEVEWQEGWEEALAKARPHATTKEAFAFESDKGWWASSFEPIQPRPVSLLLVPVCGHAAKPPRSQSHCGANLRSSSPPAWTTCGQPVFDIYIWCHLHFSHEQVCLSRSTRIYVYFKKKGHGKEITPAKALTTWTRSPWTSTRCMWTHFLLLQAALGWVVKHVGNQVPVILHATQCLLKISHPVLKYLTRWGLLDRRSSELCCQRGRGPRNLLKKILERNRIQSLMMSQSRSQSAGGRNVKLEDLMSPTRSRSAVGRKFSRRIWWAQAGGRSAVGRKFQPEDLMRWSRSRSAVGRKFQPEDLMSPSRSRSAVGRKFQPEDLMRRSRSRSAGGRKFKPEDLMRSQSGREDLTCPSQSQQLILLTSKAQAKGQGQKVSCPIQWCCWIHCYWVGCWWPCHGQHCGHMRSRWCCWDWWWSFRWWTSRCTTSGWCIYYGNCGGWRQEEEGFPKVICISCCQEEGPSKMERAWTKPRRLQSWLLWLRFVKKLVCPHTSFAFLSPFSYTYNNYQGKGSEYSTAPPNKWHSNRIWWI